MQVSDTSVRHIAIIMDGNGRWAKSRYLPRTAGHKEGVSAVKRTIEASAELGVEYLTLFGFSSENWKRPLEEVTELMRLLRYYLRSETAELHRNNVKLRIIGHREDLAGDIIDLIEYAENLTKDNDGLNVVIALNYGGRADILRAAVNMSRDYPDLDLSDPENLTQTLFGQYLYTAYIPDPDILIRTSGEKRMSNFLLWQCAYSEFVFMDVLWPDFGKAELKAAIAEYKQRDRRYGGLAKDESNAQEV